MGGSGNGIGGLVVVGVIVAGLALHAAYLWLARHWYVEVILVLAAAAIGYVVITTISRSRRERRERLARLRYTGEEIDAMSPAAFELACRDLMRRDGLRAEQVGAAMIRRPT